MNNNKNSGTIVILSDPSLVFIYFYCKNFNINFNIKKICFTKNTKTNNFIFQNKLLKNPNLKLLKTTYKTYASM